MTPFWQWRSLRQLFDIKPTDQDFRAPALRGLRPAHRNREGAPT
jgi:hypothetical protein